MFAGTSVDGACQRLTASFQRAKRELDPSLPACEFFENLEENFALPSGVWNLVGNHNYNFYIFLLI